MRGRLRRMTQNMVAFCRLNTDTVPHEVVTKVVGEEYRRQIRDEALEGIEGERVRAQFMERDRLERMRREVDGVKYELAHPPLIRRLMKPMETLWAWGYAIVREVPAAILDRICAGWMKRRK